MWVISYFPTNMRTGPDHIRDGTSSIYKNWSREPGSSLAKFSQVTGQLRPNHENKYIACLAMKCLRYILIYFFIHFSHLISS